MANNLKELRLMMLLTPTEVAARIGTDAAQVERLERPDRDLEEEWVDAIARGLGVPHAAVTDPKADIRQMTATAGGEDGPPAATLCPIGLRYAILAATAKLAGPKTAALLNEDALMTAVQNVIRYVERDDRPTEAEQFNRLSQALQITVLTILESRGADQGPQFQKSIRPTLEGATRLVTEFSRPLD
jgi:transcriptional regulator with XRE-family HTH domain